MDLNNNSVTEPGENGPDQQLNITTMENRLNQQLGDRTMRMDLINSMVKPGENGLNQQHFKTTRREWTRSTAW